MEADPLLEVTPDTGPYFNAKAERRRTRSLVHAVVRQHGYKCHWCGVALVIPSEFGRWVRIVKQDNNWVHYEAGGKSYTSHILTLDHLIPIRKQGKSVLGNLVPACSPCNSRRDALDVESERTDAEKAARLRDEWDGLVVGICHPSNPKALPRAYLPETLFVPCPAELTHEETCHWVTARLRLHYFELRQYLPEGGGLLNQRWVSMIGAWDRQKLPSERCGMMRSLYVTLCRAWLNHYPQKV